MFWRLSCHMCGTRSKHSKGTEEFQCSNCEGWCFFDKKGNVLDTPWERFFGDAPPDPVLPYKPLQTKKPEEDETFCTRCLNNQRIYMESVSNYLPDPDEVGYVKYRQFERKLPQYKVNLEERFPQVCKTCAHKAQEKIRNADIKSQMKVCEVAARETYDRRMKGLGPDGKRDDWPKWTMRFLLSLLGMIRYASVLIQSAWHVYGILALLFLTTSTDTLDTTSFAFDPTFTDCARQTWSMRLDKTCYQLFSTLIPKALLMSLLLLWYNHGLKDWWHPTYRMVAALGTTEHRSIQAFMLAVRTAAWYKLSDPTVTAGLKMQQLLGAHGFMIVFMFIAQWISVRVIKTDQRWTMQQKMMPSVEDVDVFGPTAGPAIEQYERKASAIPAARDDPRLKTWSFGDRPFDINSLAPMSNTRNFPQQNTYGGMRPPTPPDSQDMSDDGDEMDVDSGYGFRPTPFQAPMRSSWNYGTAQPSGWGPMRKEIYGMQNMARLEEERKRQEEEIRAKLRYQPPVEQSPFHTRLPPAPMSMERRLRNPPTNPVFNPTPVTQQKDFFQQMRNSVENPTTFAKKKPEKHVTFKNSPSIHEFEKDESEQFTPAKDRTKGQLELHDSGWRLPGDGMQKTGLEDLFAGKGFSISDEPGIKIAAAPESSSIFSWRLLAVVVPVVAITVAWNIMPVRKAVCLWLVQQLEDSLFIRFVNVVSGVLAAGGWMFQVREWAKETET